MHIAQGFYCCPCYSRFNSCSEAVLTVANATLLRLIFRCLFIRLRVMSVFVVSVCSCLLYGSCGPGINALIDCSQQSRLCCNEL